MEKQHRPPTQKEQIREPEVAAADPETRAARLVADLGGHWSAEIGLDLDEPDDEQLGRWLVATCLSGGRHGDDVAASAFSALVAKNLVAPAALAASDPIQVEIALDATGIPKPDVIARLLVRVCSALAERYGGSVSRLVGEADGLEELAGRLSALGSGFGRAAVLRFLTPLRGAWALAADLPATPAVRAAAVHLGLIPDWQDEEGTPASLARALTPAGIQQIPPVRDVEAALERLGRKACLRGQVQRCPLGQDCPARQRPEGGEDNP